MAYVPGTEIEQPEVDLTGRVGLQRVNTAKRALRRAGVPEGVITTFLQATGAEFGNASEVEAVIEQYVVVAP